MAFFEVIRSLEQLRSLRVRCKASAYRWWFRNFGGRSHYPVIQGRVLRTLREEVMPLLEYTESVCNAGMISSEEGYLCVAKNQRFTLANEQGRRSAANRQPVSAEDDAKLLYQLRFGRDWRLLGCTRLDVFVDGRMTSLSDGIEDVRLFRMADVDWAYATGSGNRRSSWPLIGKLTCGKLSLKSVVAPYSPPQKNWMPFVQDGCIFLEQSVLPHIVLRYDPETALCEPAGDSTFESPGAEGLEIHGGAPAIRLTDQLWLGVGNSQRRFWYQERYYAPVFYLFEAAPPFRIVKMSRPVRLLSRRGRVQYVTGMILQPDRLTLTLSYGMSDHDNVFLAVALGDVLKLLGANDLISEA